MIRMAAREMVTLRLANEDIEQLMDLAGDETGGNRSELIRTLIREALAARQNVDAQSSRAS